MIDLANKAGGEDNITVVLVGVSDGEDGDDPDDAPTEVDEKPADSGKGDDSADGEGPAGS